MSPKATASVATLLFSLVVTLVGSLLAVWGLSSAIGFRFNPSTVAVLSVSVYLAALAATRRKNKGRQGENRATGSERDTDNKLPL